MTSFLFNIPPQWDIEKYKALDYKLDTHKVQEDNQRYIDAGHPKDALTLYNYFEPNLMPHSIEYIKSYFPDLKNISVAVNLFRPGQYIPIHSDRYGAYKKHNGITEDKIISRYIIMLEDHVPGQMLDIAGSIYTGWSAGDVYRWEDNTPHTFYNLSTKDRYAIQLTAI